MNWQLIGTIFGIGVVGLFLLPFYLSMFIVLERQRAKIHLELFATANTIEKKVKFDEAVERLFEEGVQE